jgi:formimidoylglutamate deiminase
MSEAEIGWLPDYLYRDGHFESEVAFFVDRVGKVTRVSSNPADLSRAKRLPRQAILPGLVNAHSHAFQRAIRGRTENRTAGKRDNFWTWREAMYRAANGLSPEDIFDVSRMAFLEMLVSGITTVGEFHYLHHDPNGRRYSDPNMLAKQVIRAAQQTGLRIALLRTAYVRAGWQMEANPGQARFVTKELDVFLGDTEALAQSFSSDRAWVGIAPHSVRAVPLPFLIEAVRHGRLRGWPVHMHVAEQPEEVNTCEAEYGRRPVELLEEHGILDKDFTAIHVTHTTPEEIGYLAKANICACPTTERNLGDGIAPADKWAQAGINVCFGSDSNVQINLLEDARELEYHLRLKRLERAILDAPRLFHYATGGGSQSLRSGQQADFFTIDLDDLSIVGTDRDSLLAHTIFAAQRCAVRDVYIGGERIVEDGHHKDERVIIERFSALQKRLWS